MWVVIDGFRTNCVGDVTRNLPQRATSTSLNATTLHYSKLRNGHGPDVPTRCVTDRHPTIEPDLG
jgi:hypothetical protein